VFLFEVDFHGRFAIRLQRLHILGFGGCGLGRMIKNFAIAMNMPSVIMQRCSRHCLIGYQAIAPGFVTIATPPQSIGAPN
jgi:hypothetical protein